MTLDGFEVNLDERGAGDAGIQLVQGILFGADGMKDSALFSGVGDRGGEGGEVGGGSLFEVKGHAGVGEDVGVPASGAGEAGNVEDAVQVMEPDLNPAGVAALSAGGGDIDDEVFFQGLLDFGLEHDVGSPVRGQRSSRFGLK